MKITFFGLLIAAKATQMTTTAQGITKVQNKVSSVRALNGEITDDDGVDPSVIGGTILDRNVWKQSRRYLVDLHYGNPSGHGCGGTKVSSQVVLTAARELIQYK